MAVTVIGSVRSCGVTTLALTLAATWPSQRRVLLAELDPAGGTLAAACGWPSEPSLVSLAAAARRGGDPAMVWQHCQALSTGSAVLAGPVSAEHAQSALAMLGELTRRLSELDADVLVDGGRLDPVSPVSAVLDGADLALLAVRPRLTDLHALATWLDSHSIEAEQELIVIGDGPYSDAEIAEALGIPVLARVPWDPDAAQAIVSVPADSRELRLAPLVRAARSLADRLAREFDPLVPTSVAHAAAETSMTLRRKFTRALRPVATTAPSMNGVSDQGSSG